MLHLTRTIDRATGYVYLPLSQPSSSSPTQQNPNIIPPPPTAPLTQHPNAYGLMSTAAGPMKGRMSDVRDVQERWVDAREEWDAWERKEWRKEGEIVRREVEKMQKAQEQEGRTRQGGDQSGKGLKVRERGDYKA